MRINLGPFGYGFKIWLRFPLLLVVSLCWLVLIWRVISLFFLWLDSSHHGHAVIATFLSRCVSVEFLFCFGLRWHASFIIVFTTFFFHRSFIIAVNEFIFRVDKIIGRLFIERILLHALLSRRHPWLLRIVLILSQLFIQFLNKVRCIKTIITFNLLRSELTTIACRPIVLIAVSTCMSAVNDVFIMFSH